MSEPLPPSSVRHAFDNVVDLPAAERGSLLSALCGEDAALRNAVDALLEAHDRLERAARAKSASVDPDEVVRERDR